MRAAVAQSLWYCPVLDGVQIGRGILKRSIDVHRLAHLTKGVGILQRGVFHPLDDFLRKGARVGLPIPFDKLTIPVAARKDTKYEYRAGYGQDQNGEQIPQTESQGDRWQRSSSVGGSHLRRGRLWGLLGGAFQSSDNVVRSGVVTGRLLWRRLRPGDFQGMRTTRHSYQKQQVDHGSCQGYRPVLQTKEAEGEGPDDRSVQRQGRQPLQAAAQTTSPTHTAHGSLRDGRRVLSARISFYARENTGRAEGIRKQESNVTTTRTVRA